MTKTMSLVSALLCTFIWGTTFIAQDTGMDEIGPLTFNGARFFIGFLSVLPFAILFEKKKIIKEINLNKKLFFKLLFFVGLFLFLGTYVQQAALLYTDIANAAFFTIFYVPIVPIILYFFYNKSIHWSIWPSILFCIAGVYLLSDFSNATMRKGDGLVILCAIFWSLHIIFIGKFIKQFDLPLSFGALQALLVAFFSTFFAIIFETVTFSNILNEYISIIYAGALSGGVAFTLQIYAQKNISAAPAAIIFSLEGVFAAVAAWLILNQILGFNNILGCVLILLGVLFSQLAPLYKKKLKVNYT
ncbi:MAG: EamA family transporter [Candidatus Pelagibacter sp. TMED64]|nr:EamA family transporter [Candidatus Pelagibacter sp.]OUU66198.1 MAG: EamA family transporter [Candidatus Pelagibacter sp. TMED64]